MGGRAQKKRRRMRNRYRSPWGRGMHQKWNPETQSFEWVEAKWSEAANEWRLRPKNWEPTAPLYFAYGSNLNVKQMGYRCPEARLFAPMTLPGWKLVFRGVADIVPDPEGPGVQGGLWTITGADEAELDRYEGVKGGLYEKDYFSVYYTDEAGERQERKVLVYRMKRDSALLRPWDVYYQTILEGYQDFGLNVETLEKAREEAPPPKPWPRYTYYGAGSSWQRKDEQAKQDANSAEEKSAAQDDIPYWEREYWE